MIPDRVFTLSETSGVMIHKILLSYIHADNSTSQPAKMI